MNDIESDLKTEKSKLNIRDILVKILRNSGVYLALLVLIIISGVLEPRSLEVGHVLDILKNTSVLGIVVIAQTLLIIIRGIDLSVGAHLILITLIIDGISMGVPQRTALVIILSLVVGALIGLINGLLSVKLKIEPLVSSLGVMTLITGISFIYTKGFAKGKAPPFVNMLGGKELFGFLPVSVIIWAILAVIVIFVLKRTVFGRFVYAIGANPKAASIAGIKTDKVAILIYVISGLLVAIAGIVWAGYIGVPSLTGGETYPLDSIAAVIIGGTTFAGGKGGIGGSIVGAIIIVFLSSFLNIVGLGHAWKIIAQGLIILLLVFSYTGRKKLN